ncbi:MAG: hypothetical protein ISR64_03170 [Deltaproteobacteria bacterium]|nr:hypothetical protein [Deltaproteobacteria bacterium]
MVRCAAVGASGYSGAELVALLYRHPGVEIASVHADTHAGKRWERGGLNMGNRLEKARRQREIVDLVQRESVGSQEGLAAALARGGFDVTEVHPVEGHQGTEGPPCPPGRGIPLSARPGRVPGTWGSFGKPAPGIPGPRGGRRG